MHVLILASICNVKVRPIVISDKLLAFKEEVTGQARSDSDHCELIMRGVDEILGCI